MNTIRPLGDLAVEYKFISREILEHCRNLQGLETRATPLEEILVREGYLTSHQVELIEKMGAYLKKRKRDRKLAAMAVQAHMLAEERAKALLDEQERRFQRRAEIVSLRSLLLESGLVDPQRFENLLKKAGFRTIRYRSGRAASFVSRWIDGEAPPTPPCEAADGQKAKYVRNPEARQATRSQRFDRDMEETSSSTSRFASRVCRREAPDEDQDRGDTEVVSAPPWEIADPHRHDKTTTLLPPRDEGPDTDRTAMPVVEETGSTVTGPPPDSEGEDERPASSGMAATSEERSRPATCGLRSPAGSGSDPDIRKSQIASLKLLPLVAAATLSAALVSATLVAFEERLAAHLDLVAPLMVRARAVPASMAREAPAVPPAVVLRQARRGRTPALPALPALEQILFVVGILDHPLPVRLNGSTLREVRVLSASGALLERSEYRHTGDQMLEVIRYDRDGRTVAALDYRFAGGRLVSFTESDAQGRTLATATVRRDAASRLRIIWRAGDSRFEVPVSPRRASLAIGEGGTERRVVVRGEDLVESRTAPGHRQLYRFSRGLLRSWTYEEPGRELTARYDYSVRLVTETLHERGKPARRRLFLYR